MLVEMEEEDLGATVEEKGTVAEEVARAREEMAAVAKVVTEAVKAAEGEAADSEAAVDWAVENTEVMAKVEVKMKDSLGEDKNSSGLQLSWSMLGMMLGMLCLWSGPMKAGWSEGLL
ncbi:hypothetical protein CYMTET_30886 [Cymbomonas tetramitiformis]|uniref:Uncharacterized protein n=1 Tax=Cymbomonas tetramitiformis TaxID=36881 RepID=A0AAE0FIG3_9CHLO|nr:hypothetical protein CYMTET_30886 [Cymbomonas tetramitiformis]